MAPWVPRAAICAGCSVARCASAAVIANAAIPKMLTLLTDLNVRSFFPDVFPMYSQTASDLLRKFSES
jgi:hypothetical protein